MTKPITKSGFKLALECPLKLRHARAQPALPRTTDQNELLRLLAEGGGAVEALQRAVEPGLLVGMGSAGSADAAARSLSAIASAAAVLQTTGKPQSLYEVTIIHDGLLARLDLLRIFPDRLELGEIKAKSVDGNSASEALGEMVGTRTPILAEWLPYLQDVAFQAYLLEAWLTVNAGEAGLRAKTPVVPKLLLVKKCGKASPSDVLSNFSSSYTRGRDGSIRPSVEYVGQRPESTQLLIGVSVGDLVQLLRADARAKSDALAGMGIAGCVAAIKRMVETDQWPNSLDQLGAKCKRCEFKTADSSDRDSGYGRCWGARAYCRHHVLTLAWVKDDQVREAIAAAGSRPPQISDLADGSIKAAQQTQYEALAQRHGPIVKAAFRAAPDAALCIGPAGDPVYFVDFECAMYPIPSRVGGRPYETVPFQFAAHRLSSFDAPLGSRTELTPFLDLAGQDPRRGFLRALKEQLGDRGVVYHWHSYEATTLNALAAAIRSEAPAGDPDDDQLLAFIDSLTGASGRLVDLLPIAKDAFYHPDMDGSYSIKRVLPVVWREASIRAEFADKYPSERDPYDSLPRLDSEFIEAIGGLGAATRLQEAIDADSPAVPEPIRNGGMALLYYHYARMFGATDRPEVRAQFLNYCGLDSEAMIMVYGYLRRVLPIVNPGTAGNQRNL